MSEEGKSDGDRGVEMGTRDMTHRIDHDHHDQPPDHADPWKRDRPVYLVHHHRPAPCKHHEVRPDHLGNHLQKEEVEKLAGKKKNVQERKRARGILFYLLGEGDDLGGGTAVHVQVSIQRGTARFANLRDRSFRHRLVDVTCGSDVPDSRFSGGKQGTREERMIMEEFEGGLISFLPRVYKWRSKQRRCGC